MTNKTNKDMTFYEGLLNIQEFTSIFEALKEKYPDFSAKVIKAFYEDKYDIYNLYVEFEYPTLLKDDIVDFIYE